MIGMFQSMYPHNRIIVCDDFEHFMSSFLQILA